MSPITICEHCNHRAINGFTNGGVCRMLLTWDPGGKELWTYCGCMDESHLNPMNAAVVNLAVASASPQELGTAATLIRTEQQRREQIEQNREEQIEVLRNKALWAMIPQLLGVIPHSRTSCSDKDPNNINRCGRCTLLSLRDKEWLQYDLDGVQIEIQVLKPKED